MSPLPSVAAPAEAVGGRDLIFFVGGRAGIASKGDRNTVGSKKLKHGCSRIYAGIPSFYSLGLEEGRVPTFWLLL